MPDLGLFESDWFRTMIHESLVIGVRLKSLNSVYGDLVASPFASLRPVQPNLAGAPSGNGR